MTRVQAFFRAIVWCGEKSVLDCARLTLPEARGRVRSMLAEHAADVTAWFIYDESECPGKRVAGCAEIGEEDEF